MSTNNLNVNSDTENTDDDLDSLLAESLLEVERKKALKKIARDKVNSRLLTEEQKELLQQEENLKWVDKDLIMYVEVQTCSNCQHTHIELKGFYQSQSRLNSPETKRLLKINYNESLHFKSFTVNNSLPFCAYCIEPSTDIITLNELPILKGLL